MRATIQALTSPLALLSCQTGPNMSKSSIPHPILACSTPFHDMRGSGARICEVKVFSRAERLGWGGGVCCGMCGAHARVSWRAPCQAPIKHQCENLSCHDHEHFHAPFAKHVRAICKSRDSFIEALTNTYEGQISALSHHTAQLKNCNTRQVSRR